MPHPNLLLSYRQKSVELTNTSTHHKLVKQTSGLSTHFLQRTERDFIFLPPASSPSLPTSHMLPTSLAADWLLSSKAAASLSRSRAELAAAISIFKFARGVKGVPARERQGKEECLKLCVRVQSVQLRGCILEMPLISIPTVLTLLSSRFRYNT